MKTFQDFSPYNGGSLGTIDSLETKWFKVQKTVLVQTTNCSKGFKQFHTMNKGLIMRNNRSFNK